MLRRTQDLGASVTVVPTEEALRFVGTATWEALSGRPVRTDVFDDVPLVPHVRLGRAADLLVVAPATANLIARAAHGLASDLLTNTLLTARCPILMFPAMHTEMWEHPAIVANVATLRERGVIVVDPAEGRLTGTDAGPGRMSEPEEILPWIHAALTGRDRPRDLSGRRIVVSAGGTRERLDPVRFIGNRSSGRQGMALAAAAAFRGADVTVVAGQVDAPAPAGVRVVSAPTADDILQACRTAADGADAVIMCAAIADFRPEQFDPHKIKKTGAGRLDLRLVANPDVLATLVAERRGARPVLVGFAAETGDQTTDWLVFARRKLAAKGCDLIVANPVGLDHGFEGEQNQAVILGADGREVPVGLTDKMRVAHAVLDQVASGFA